MLVSYSRSLSSYSHLATGRESMGLKSQKADTRVGLTRVGLTRGWRGNGVVSIIMLAMYVRLGQWCVGQVTHIDLVPGVPDAQIMQQSGLIQVHQGTYSKQHTKHLLLAS